MRRFNQGCRAENDFADPLVDRKEVFEEVDYHAFRQLAPRDSQHPHATDAIVELCSSPRVLKHALRRCLEVRRTLAGEIDFDDVLMMSVLRAAEPEVFAAVDAHIDGLRGGDERLFDDESNRGRPHTLPRLVEWFQNWTEKTGTDTARFGAIKFVLDNVFGREVDPHGESRYRKNPNRLQGLATERSNADYWRRFQTAAPVAKEDCDQRVLRLIDEHDFLRLAELLGDPKRYATVEHFASRLNSEAPYELLRLIFEARLPERPSTWPQVRDGLRVPPGLRPFVQILKSRQIDSRRLADLIATLADRGIVGNLALVASVVRWLVSVEGPNAVADEIRSRIAASFTSKYQDQPGRLDTSLQDASDGFLRAFCLSLNLIPSTATDPVSDGWRAFAPTLIKAARQFPETVLPQLSYFVVEVTATGNGFGRCESVYEPNQAEAIRLFGKWDEVRDVFNVAAIDGLDAHGPYQAMRRAASEAMAVS